MKWYRIWALCRKDIKEFTRSKYVLISVLLMPIFLAVFMPMSSIIPMSYMDESDFEDESDFGEGMNNFFSQIVKDWNELNEKAKSLILQAYIMLFVIFMVPIIIPSIVASETIVGEKERKTMESLLAYPLTKQEIVMGKMLSSFIPGVLATLVAGITYSIVVNIALYSSLNRLLFPDLLMLYVMLIQAPLLIIMTLEVMIMISTKVSSVRDGYQFGGLLVLPLFLFVGVQMVFFFLNPLLTLIIGTGILILFALLFYRIAINIFDRDKALTKLV